MGPAEQDEGGSLQHSQYQSSVNAYPTVAMSSLAIESDTSVNMPRSGGG